MKVYNSGNTQEYMEMHLTEQDFEDIKRMVMKELKERAIEIERTLRKSEAKEETLLRKAA